MATKAEQFRAEAQRKARPGRAAGGGHLSAGIRAARRGRTKDRLPNPTSHNEAPRSKRKEKRNFTYELEPSTTSRPPRKSTRGSPTRQKTDSSLRTRAMNLNATPGKRAGRRTGNPK
jgi:hypothetical protein